MFFPKSFFKKSIQILGGLISLLCACLGTLSLWTYDAKDCSFNTYNLAPIQNSLGMIGAYLSDVLIQIFGGASYAFIVIPLYVGIITFTHYPILWGRIGLFISLIVNLCVMMGENTYKEFWKLGGIFATSSFEFKCLAGIMALMCIVGIFYKLPFRKTFQKKSGETLNNYKIQGEDPYDTPSFRTISHEACFSVEKLQRTLEDFGVKGEILEQSTGPVVSSFLFKPQATIKSSRVISLSYDLLEIFDVPSVRIIEHQQNILIEIAHRNPIAITLDECLPVSISLKLPLILGKDTKGQPVVVDLVRLPHLLVSGIKGKTNFLNHILQTQYHAQCRLVDDIKKGEWDLYTDQLLDPSSALKTIIKEMEQRYRAMSQLGVRNIEEFNACLQERNALKRCVQTGFDNETGKPIFENQALHYQPFSYQIVLIQELLSIASTEEEQTYLQRCCSMSRAVGIHFIVATKHKPSALIQATFPVRLSFKTASRFESCFLIEGTEHLCPYGDALFKNGNVQRIHTISAAQPSYPVMKASA